ncbi:FtsQ-type POTRA domain-containing protein [Persephonella atlantica]|uniref:FtsQ-type POTRA domain-containing protein n=1 Tax=Persephonella atlantica TaxID=2699429 RepID=A0ABS1GF76_9AQUI|nr:FtsQ-type POTRA domain-containing protein [Persephonella atlantica]MBK3331511.1 FtsQ-type POTRA domain-containing protein [Persephonella atlantica]
MKSKKTKLLVAGIWITICASFGFFSPTIPFVKEFFEIKKVYVKGTDKFSKQDIKKIFERENWFFINKNEIKRQLKDFNFVKDVEINRLFVGSIDLIVLERRPFAVLHHRNRTYLIDEEGVKLSQKYYKIRKELPQLYYNDQKISKEKLKKISLLKEEFRGRLKFKKFYIYKSQIACKTEDGKDIIFSIEDIEKSIERAKIFLKKAGIDQFRYLNFSFEHMVIARR